MSPSQIVGPVRARRRRRVLPHHAGDRRDALAHVGRIARLRRAPRLRAQGGHQDQPAGRHRGDIRPGQGLEINTNEHEGYE